VEARLGSAEGEPIADAADPDGVSFAVEGERARAGEPPMTRPALMTLKLMPPLSAYAAEPKTAPAKAGNATRLARRADKMRMRVCSLKTLEDAGRFCRQQAYRACRPPPVSLQQHTRFFAASGVEPLCCAN
jgi:hypothetical protein